MDVREDLKVLLLDILSDPDFERELYKRKLLNSYGSLSPHGQRVAREDKKLQEYKVNIAIDHLFGGD